MEIFVEVNTRTKVGIPTKSIVFSLYAAPAEKTGIFHNVLYLGLFPNFF